MKTSQKIKMFVPLLLMSFFSFPVAYASEITDVVKEMVDEAIEVVSREELKGDEKRDERISIVRKIVSKKFSYPEMSRRTLAKYWKERTSEEKEEFVFLFGKLLENSYAKKMEKYNYNNEKVLYLEEKVRKNIALVKTVIKRDDDEIPVNYKLVKVGDDWKIYDFIVEGVSIVKNYRAQFNKIIHESSYQELVKKLKKKLEDIG